MSTLTHRLDALAAVPWGSAPHWDPDCRSLIDQLHGRLARYRDLLPGGPRLTDTRLRDAVLTMLTPEDRSSVEEEARAVVHRARESGVHLEAETVHAVPLVLAWARLVDDGRLAAEDDPGAPLMALLQAGFQLHRDHVGLEVHYADGWVTLPPPTWP